MVENIKSSGPIDPNDSLPPPLVSLCMPVFNGENFIEEALDSIGQQDFNDFELIVTDNASTDATEEIVRRYAASDKRIRYVRNETNIGAAENYNLGFNLACGRYIKWMAHDDTLSPDFLSKTVALLDEDPTVSVAFGRTQCIDENSNFIEMQGFAMRENLSDNPADRFYRAMRGWGSCFPIFGLYRADQLARSSLHRSHYYGSDNALIAEMMIFGKLRIDEAATFYNRFHAAQSCAAEGRAERTFWQGNNSSRFSSLERINLLIHLVEIAGRHPDLAPRSKLYFAVAKYALRPVEVGRYLIEIVQFISPSLGGHIRSIAKRLRGRFSKIKRARDIASPDET